MEKMGTPRDELVIRGVRGGKMLRHTGLYAIPLLRSRSHTWQFIYDKYYCPRGAMSLSAGRITMRLNVLLALALSVLSCEQYEYSSPHPGIIEVRLAVANNRQTLLPFASSDSLGFASNFLFMNLRDLTVTQAGDIDLPIFADLSAIRRNSDGDPFNCLDVKARDSLLILGRAYAPPETFTGLKLIIEPPPNLFISQGFYGSEIPIVQVPPIQALQKFPRAGSNLNITVQQGRVTQVTVTFDMDTSLAQRSETFDYIPNFYISSVINY